MSQSITIMAAAAALAAAGAAQAQYLMMPDSTNNRIVLFDPNDGSLVDSDFFPLAGGTPLHAMQVGNEIWVSEQVGDRVSRWDFDGNSLGAVTGGMDNIRGMALIGDRVYVTNSGTSNGAPGNAIVMFDTSGNALGSFTTNGLAPSPFGILAHQGGMLVSSSSGGDDIHRFDLSGNSLGTFHNSTSISFVEQLAHASNGNVLAAGFSTPAGVYELDPDSGAIVGSFAGSGVRGVYALANGDIMWTNSSGAWVYDPNTQQSTQVYAGGCRYLDVLNITPPGPTLRLSGDCPGTITVAWSNAPANRQMGIVFASSQGNFTIPGGPCAGTQLGLGTQNLRLVNVVNTGSSGSGSVNGLAGSSACGGYLQLVIAEGNPCATSNVAQVP
ncbi:MAG: hypothetical protein KJZ69_11110 [Phycisphaerales bacterium]|nr:hypothetical protein [Phycisphaerales bacterium]